MAIKTQRFVIQVLELSIYTFLAIYAGVSLAYLSADYIIWVTDDGQRIPMTADMIKLMKHSTLVFIVAISSLAFSLTAIGLQWIRKEIGKDIAFLDKRIKGEQ
jgi:hypothetical protein